MKGVTSRPGGRCNLHGAETRKPRVAHRSPIFFEPDQVVVYVGPGIMHGKSCLVESVVPRIDGGPDEVGFSFWHFGERIYTRSAADHLRAHPTRAELRRHAPRRRRRARSHAS